MRTGAARPPFSWMIGPVGTCEATGAGPRPGGIRAITNPELSGSHLNGVPRVAFSSGPTMRFASPVATSATHSSSPSATPFTKARCRLSGDHCE